MSRLTKKMMGNVLLPVFPLEINSKEDLDKYHQLRRETDAMILKLSEYEDREEINDCKYCCGDVDDREYILSDENGAGIYIDGNGNLIGDDIFGLNSRKLKFCSECGRKL